MKLTSIEIHPSTAIPAVSNPVVLSFRDPKSLRPYQVKNIDGLDPDVITPKYYGSDGTKKFYNLTLASRDITILAGLNPYLNLSQSYSDLRDRLYKIVASSRTGQQQIKFKNGSEVVAVLNGYISKFETAHFEKVQEVLITISCDEPLLKAPVATIIPSVNALDPALTTIDDVDSTAPHGFSFRLAINAPFASLTIDDPYDTSWSFIITPITGFLAGDVLYFSSESSDKYLYVNRGGNIIYLADAIQIGSVWPIIFPGENRLSLTNSPNVDWIDISYFATYWGV